MKKPCSEHDDRNVVKWQCLNCERLYCFSAK